MLGAIAHWMQIGIVYVIVGRGAIALIDWIERKRSGHYAMQFWDEDEEALTGFALLAWPFVAFGAVVFYILFGVVIVAVFTARLPTFIAGAAGDTTRELRVWIRSRPERRAARLAQIERDADDVVRMISEGR